MMFKTRARQLFALGLVLRLCALPFGGSAVVREYFIPFLDAGVTHLSSNPWTLHPPRYFPYGSVLYGLMALPRLLGATIFGSAALGDTYLSMALFKLPLLMVDLWLVYLLTCLAPKRRKQLMVYYWLNPILFFITYVHGQLDVAATACCTAAMLFAIRNRAIGAGLMMGAATLCKTHVVLCLPLFVAFLSKQQFLRRGLVQTSQFSFAWAATTLAGFWPHICAQTLAYVTATSPQAFRVFDARIDLDQGQVIYLGIGLVAVLLGRLCIARRISELGLIFGCGLLFGVLLLITNSSPGWYFWPMPFIALLYAQYTQASVMLYVAYCALYLTYFAGLSYVPAGFVHSTVFTLLHTVLAVLLYTIWQIVVRNEAPLDPKRRPILFGIAGDSGTGKNVLSQVIADLFDPKSSAFLEGDDYHKWERGNPKWGDYTHLDPKANHLDALAVHTGDLLLGRLVWQPQYDHGCGQFTAPREIRSSKVVIIQGLHTLYLRDMRAQLNVKIFLAPHPVIRRAWKIRRDVLQRGHALERVLKSMAARHEDAKLHIDPQRDSADWIIEATPDGEPPSDVDLLKGQPIAFYTRHILWNDVPVSKLCQLLGSTVGCRSELAVVPGNLDRVTLTVRGHLSAQQIEHIGLQLYPNLRTITDCFQPPVWQADDQGVQQLIALSFLSRQQNHADHH